MLIQALDQPRRGADEVDSCAALERAVPVLRHGDGLFGIDRDRRSPPFTAHHRPYFLMRHAFSWRSAWSPPPWPSRCRWRLAEGRPVALLDRRRC